MRVRSIPTEKEAIQFDGKNTDTVFQWAQRVSPINEPVSNVLRVVRYETAHPDDLLIKTPEGEMLATTGDWIICGIHGEFYPCKPDIFAKSYEVLP